MRVADRFGSDSAAANRCGFGCCEQIRLRLQVTDADSAAAARFGCGCRTAVRCGFRCCTQTRLRLPCEQIQPRRFDCRRWMRVQRQPNPPLSAAAESESVRGELESVCSSRIRIYRRRSHLAPAGFTDPIAASSAAPTAAPARVFCPIDGCRHSDPCACRAGIPTRPCAIIRSEPVRGSRIRICQRQPNPNLAAVSGTRVRFCHRQPCPRLSVAAGPNLFPVESASTSDSRMRICHLQPRPNLFAVAESESVGGS